MLIIYSNVGIRKFPAQKFWLVPCQCLHDNFCFFFNKYRCAIFVVVFQNIN